LAIAASGGVAVTIESAGEAQATTHAAAPTAGEAAVAQAKAKGRKASPKARKALSVARSKKGRPYRYGASGPNAFDCSGYTQYSYERAGLRLPRTASQQYRATWHVSKARRLPGDLVFFGSGSNKYHVGLYAGKGWMWDAAHSGTRIHARKIWTSKVSYGRVKGGWPDKVANAMSTKPMGALRYDQPDN
jgi:cell wall-associated NlpC family hydrolase